MRKHSLGAFGVAAAGVAVVSIAVACGGKVTWVEDGQPSTGGSGSTSTNVTSTKSSTSGPGPGPTTSTGQMKTDCEQICSIPACSNGDPNCVPSCQTLFTPGCEKQAGDYLDCLAANLDQSCALPNGVCDAVANAYSACTNPPNCQNVTCSEGDSFCECSGLCFNSKDDATCKATPMGFQCSCTQDGVLIGTCSSMGPSCDLEGGCCAQFFHPFID
jgi:hypothetical protein